MWCEYVKTCKTENTHLGQWFLIKFSIVGIYHPSFSLSLREEEPPLSIEEAKHRKRVSCGFSVANFLNLILDSNGNVQMCTPVLYGVNVRAEQINADKMKCNIKYIACVCLVLRITFPAETTSKIKTLDGLTRSIDQNHIHSLKSAVACNLCASKHFSCP